MRLLAVSMAVVVVLAGCTSHGGGKHSSVPPGDTASAPGASDPDEAAASFDRAAGAWAASIENGATTVVGYADQINVKHDTAAQLATQSKDCDIAQSALATSGRPPVLDTVPANGSQAYLTAQAKAKKLPGQAKSVREDLNRIVRFCTWLNTFKSGELAADAANASLFSTPLRYTGDIVVDKITHTCPAGASCYTPNQSLWPRIAQLWQKQGAATAQGAHAIQQDKIPCLIQGWEKVCTLVVQDQLDYETWANKYAQAFTDGQKKSLADAAVTISQVGVEFDQDVLKPMTALPGLYSRLSPTHKYSGRTSLTGADIWVAEVKDMLKALAKDVSTLG